jgi:hypothetical protein
MPKHQHPRLLILLVASIMAFCQLPPLEAGAKKAPPVTIRLHGEGNEVEGDSFVTGIELLNPARTITMRKVPAVSEGDITSFHPFENADGTFGAYFKLDAHGSNKLQQFSTEEKGRLAVVLVNGRVASALTIDSTVRDGILYVPSGILPAEVADLARAHPLIGREAEFKR